MTQNIITNSVIASHRHWQCNFKLEVKALCVREREWNRANTLLIWMFRILISQLCLWVKIHIFLIFVLRICFVCNALVNIRLPPPLVTSFFSLFFFIRDRVYLVYGRGACVTCLFQAFSFIFHLPVSDWSHPLHLLWPFLHRQMACGRNISFISVCSIIIFQWMWETFAVH